MGVRRPSSMLLRVLAAALLTAVLTQADAASGYTPLPAQAGSSGLFSDDPGVRLPLAFGPQGSRDTPGKRLAKDAHAGVQGYAWRQCQNCHTEQAGNLHTVRADVSCRQCHGQDPMASIDHYFSAMNPIRRHAYVCAKCHEGASASFATYVVHEPVPSAAETAAVFPALYYSDRFMFWLIVGVFIVFIPHGVLWWIREWLARKQREV